MSAFSDANMARNAGLDRVVSAPGLPLAVSVAIILLSLAPLFVATRRVRSAAAKFLIVALWLRLCADALQPFVLKAPLGISWNALISLVITLAGVAIVRPRMLLQRPMVPLVLFTLVGVVAGVLAGSPGDVIESTTRMLLLLVLILATQEALDVEGPRLFACLLPAVLPLFLFQGASLVLGITKAADADGSRSIIGGFLGEGAFSLAVLAALFVVVAARTLPYWSRMVGLVVCVVALLLANYRTTLVASAPILLYGVMFGAMARVRVNQRAAVLLGALLVTLLVAVAAVPQLAKRFEDANPSSSSISTVLSLPPDKFDRLDREVLTGRAYIWARYIEGWRRAPAYAKVIGSGPGHRPTDVTLYAHNSFIAALYETGVIGLGLFVFTVVGFLFLAGRARAEDRLLLLAGQSTAMILHFGTLPLWNVEGILFYALVFGATLQSAAAKAAPVRKMATAARIPADPLAA